MSKILDISISKVLDHKYLTVINFRNFFRKVLNIIYFILVKIKIE